MELTYKVDFERAVKSLAKFGDQASKKATEALDEYGQEAVTAIKKRITQLGLVNTGNLRARTTYVRTNENEAQIRVRVHYAAIHEYGGTIKPKKTAPWIITPKKAKALRFEVGGKIIFAQRVIQEPKLVFQINGKTIFAKSVSIKEKRYVRDTMEELVKKGLFEEIIADKLMDGES
jgi:phage gpG-like protein